MATLVFISNQKDKDTRLINRDPKRRERSAILNNKTQNDKDFEEAKAALIAKMRFNAFDIYDILGSHLLIIVKHGDSVDKLIDNTNHNIDIDIIGKLIYLIACFGCIYFDSEKTFELFISKNNEKFLMNFVNYDKENLLERYKADGVIHRM